MHFISDNPSILYVFQALATQPGRMHRCIKNIEVIFALALKLIWMRLSICVFMTEEFFFQRINDVFADEN
jgi:hypothetical protein